MGSLSQVPVVPFDASKPQGVNERLELVPVERFCSIIGRPKSENVVMPLRLHYHTIVS